MTMPIFPDNDQIALIERSFPQLLAVTPSVSEQFYQRLAAEHPDIFRLFEDADATGQQQKLLAAMTLLVTNLNQPTLIDSYFQALGERHQQYGVRDEMFAPFTETWLAVIMDCLGESNANTVSAAWRQLLNYVVGIMHYSVTAKAPTARTADNTADSVLTPHIADLLAQQQRLITQLSLAASREPAAQNLLADLAELRLASSALQLALSDHQSS
ncbi:MAG: globin domain-containing protein [Methylophaga sp.]